MGWLGWFLVAAGVIGLFVLWDLIFCGGKRCKEFKEFIELDNWMRR